MSSNVKVVQLVKLSAAILEELNRVLIEVLLIALKLLASYEIIKNKIS